MTSIFDPERQAHDPDARLLAALERICRVLRSRLQDAVLEIGVSPAQAQILIYLHTHGGRAYVGSLAAELGVGAPTASEAIRALEQRRFVARRRSRSDARRRTVVLTEAGRRRADRLASWPQPVAEAVATLPREEREAALCFLLDAIAELERRGLVSNLRMCRTCAYFAPAGGRYFCRLLQRPLVATELRLDCPDHRAAAS